MPELYAWIHISIDAYEEEPDELDNVVSGIRSSVDQNPVLCRNVFIPPGQSLVVMGALLNHFTQVQPYIDFFHSVSQIAPASYGLFYFRNDEGTHNKDPNKFYFLKMVRGKVEESDDTLFSPCVPVIEDTEPSVKRREELTD